MSPMRRVPLAAAACLLLAAPSLARAPGPFGPQVDPFNARGGWPDQRLNSGEDRREGRVDADTFAAQGAGEALGHGTVAVTSLPGSTATGSDEATYEAAIIDQLVKAGYETALPDPDGGQVAEIRIIRDTLVPQEAPRKPVSGAMSVGVSNRGSAVGLAVNVDMRKPRAALVSTRLEARLRDRRTGETLWEGHATIATREGDDHWNEQAIATRLAAALFERFPQPTAGAVASR